MNTTQTDGGVRRGDERLTAELVSRLTVARGGERHRRLLVADAAGRRRTVVVGAEATDPVGLRTGDRYTFTGLRACRAARAEGALAAAVEAFGLDGRVLVTTPETTVRRADADG